jgi:heptosyltransferase I
MRQLKHIKSIINSWVKYLIHLWGYCLIRPFIGKPKIQNLDNMQSYRILYVCLAFRGDLVINFPAINAIKQHFPNSHLTCWVHDYNESLLKLHTSVDESIVYERFSTRILRTLYEILFSKRHTRFINKLKEYDIYIDDSGYAFSALAGFRAKAPFRIGRNFQGFGFLNHFESPLDSNMQLIERRLKPLYPLGIRLTLADIPKPYFSINIERIKSAQDRQSIPSGNYFTVQPFTGWNSKNWGLNKYCRIVLSFSQTSGLTPVFVGSESERLMIDQAISKYGLRAVNTAGATQLDQAAAIIAGARLHLGGDSVGTHLAIALGVKSLAIFGPTNPTLSAYLGGVNIAVRKKTKCTPKPDKIYCCFDAGRGCRRLSCMSELNEGEVLQTLTELWSGKTLPSIIEF